MVLCFAHLHLEYISMIKVLGTFKAYFYKVTFQCNFFHAEFQSGESFHNACWKLHS